MSVDALCGTCGRIIEEESGLSTEHPHLAMSAANLGAKARLPLEAAAAAPLPASGLRAALRHYDERIDPERSTGEMSAREWRDAYFALARIALKELEDCRAALAASPSAGVDVERRFFTLYADAHLSNQKGMRAGAELMALAENWFDANVEGGWPLPRAVNRAAYREAGAE